MTTGGPDPTGGAPFALGGEVVWLGFGAGAGIEFTGGLAAGG